MCVYVSECVCSIHCKHTQHKHNTFHIPFGTVGNVCSERRAVLDEGEICCPQTQQSLKNTQCRAKQFTSFKGATSVHVLCGCMHYIRVCIRVCILLPKFIRKPKTPAWVMRNQKLICAKCSDSRAEAISPACVRVGVKERVCWS